MVTGQRFSVDVADPCSGMHSLFALTMIAALYAIAVFRRWWQILFIVLAAFPLAAFGNLCRILMLTFGTMSLGSSVALGTEEAPSGFHTAAGILVYLAALGGMLAIGSVLKRFGNRAEMRGPA
jgi:exosortase/archaeosortase family protein